MTIELTEKFIGFVDIMGFKSLMTRADAGNGITHSELFDINKDLMDASATGTRFFIIDPAGVDIIDKRKLTQIPLPREPLMETLLERIDGASRRSLVVTFTDDDIERRKLDHFMTASSRRKP